MENLIKKAFKLRQDTFKAFIEKGEAHLGGSFSMIEIIITLYDRILKKNDKFILSKSHASFPLCLLLKKKGYNPELTTHLELDEKNGIYCTTGSLGHGLPIATGMAFARKKFNQKGKIFILISDGECQEGTVWEAAHVARNKKLDNLIVLVDYNKSGEQLLPLDNLKEKWKSFGWKLFTVDGHNENHLIKTLKKTNTLRNRPKVIIAKTIKGKGVSFIEGHGPWHHKIPNKDEYNKIMKELTND